MINNPIPYGKQDINQQDIDAVIETLKADFLTQGPKIEEFERKFAKYIGAKYAVAVANGTAALHLSALALNVSEGQKVITTPITFAASANCIKYCGGEIVFADIDPESYLLDVTQVEELLSSHPEGMFSGIIPVDFAGRSVNLEQFRSLANDHGLWIIEDACHAPGGYFMNGASEKRFCGDGKYADLAIFSFHPVKHIASGEGGMITTNSKEMFERLLSLRTHGIVRNNSIFQNSIEVAAGIDNAVEYPAWYMEMQELGYNYRLTDIQAALGISQLSRAELGISRRREIAAKYFEAFKDDTFVKTQSGVVEGHAYHLYIIEVENRLQLYNYLRSKKIFAQIHYIPCHLMPYYREFGWNVGDLPNAEEYYKNCISLPMYPTLTEEEQENVIKEVKSFYK